MRTHGYYLKGLFMIIFILAVIVRLLTGSREKPRCPKRELQEGGTAEGAKMIS
jgi:hypothetical protein